MQFENDAYKNKRANESAHPHIFKLAHFQIS
jgi:hypothetical protein